MIKVRFKGVPKGEKLCECCRNPNGTLEVGKVYEVKFNKLSNFKTHNQIGIVGLNGFFNPFWFEPVSDSYAEKSLNESHKKTSVPPMKVKMFSSCSWEEMECFINEFLETINGRNIKEIKTHFTDSWHIVYFFYF